MRSIRAPTATGHIPLEHGLTRQRIRLETPTNRSNNEVDRQFRWGAKRSKHILRAKHVNFFLHKKTHEKRCKLCDNEVKACAKNNSWCLELEFSSCNLESSPRALLRSAVCDVSNEDLGINEACCFKAVLTRFLKFNQHASLKMLSGWGQIIKIQTMEVCPCACFWNPETLCFSISLLLIPLLPTMMLQLQPQAHPTSGTPLLLLLMTILQL